MPEADKNNIIIFDVEPEQQTGPGGRPMQPRGGFDWLKKITGRSVPAEKVQQNVTQFLTSVQEMFAEGAAAKGYFTIDAVEIDAQISAEGQVGFMGSGVGMSGSAGIKFVLKRRAGNED